MANWINITKEQFDIAYDNHLPSGWIKFAFKYFSKDTERKDMSVKNGVVTFLGSLFLVGYLGTIFNVSKKIIGTAVISYSIGLAILVLYLFSAAFLNNFRINKIRKELGITKDQYNALVSKFYS